MSDKPAERVGRRTFLGRAAMTAGAAGLAPNLVAAIPAVTAARCCDAGKGGKRALSAAADRVHKAARAIRDRAPL